MILPAHTRISIHYHHKKKTVMRKDISFSEMDIY